MKIFHYTSNLIYIVNFHQNDIFHKNDIAKKTATQIHNKLPTHRVAPVRHPSAPCATVSRVGLLVQPPRHREHATPALASPPFPSPIWAPLVAPCDRRPHCFPKCAPRSMNSPRLGVPQPAISVQAGPDWTSVSKYTHRSGASGAQRPGLRPRLPWGGAAAGPTERETGMFIPDTLRSCMVEPDVSSYLQTPSSGQVQHDTKHKKKIKKITE